MKSLIFLALLSLSFAFVPANFYNEDNFKTVSDVIAENASEPVTDVKSSDSSDYLFVKIDFDESDLSNVASELIQLFKPIVMNFTEAYSEYLSTNNVTLEDQLFYDDILTPIVQLFNETVEEKNLYDNSTENNSTIETDQSESDYLFIEIGFDDSDSYLFNNTDVNLERDVLLSVAQFVNETLHGKNVSGEVIEMKINLFNSTYMNSTQDYEDYPEYLSNNTNINLERDILLSVAQFINETRQEKGLSRDVIEKNTTIETDQSESDYLFIEIDLVESDSSDIESEIIEQFKPIFMNFTEAYSEYLSTNNVTLEDQLMYDDILTSIAQLFNETVEEQALYGDVFEKNNTAGMENGEDQIGDSFLGL